MNTIKTYSKIHRKVEFTQYTVQPRTLRVGDIIRCKDFQWGIRYTNNDLIVGWRNLSHVEYLVNKGIGTLARDTSRASTYFLVWSVHLIEGTGPEDVAPGNHRLSREVECYQLLNNFILPDQPEIIKFYLNEPISVASPDEEHIEILGYAQLPISWDE